MCMCEQCIGHLTAKVKCSQVPYLTGMAAPIAQIGKLRLGGWDACPTEVGGS